jgi:hypothetical protein
MSLVDDNVDNLHVERRPSMKYIYIGCIDYLYEVIYQYIIIIFIFTYLFLEI